MIDFLDLFKMMKEMDEKNEGYEKKIVVDEEDDEGFGVGGSPLHTMVLQSNG